MACRNLIGAFLLAALSLPTGEARGWDDAKYPNWKGQWLAVNPPLGGQTPVKFDPTKAAGPAQQAPLTPQYQKVLEDSMADQAKGGLGNYPTARCHLGGMPRTMASRFLEFVITQDTTYVLAGVDILDNRRIYTDGRDWPTDGLPTSMGYSIGKWIDETGGGHFDVLEVDTRGPFKGPRAYDSSGLPLSFDNQSTFKERLHLDKNDPNILHDEITVFDQALTRPWSVDKTFQRNPDPHPTWMEQDCNEGNVNIVIGKENYFLSADGFLMPAKKDQAPPDLRYFKQTKK
ncbi:MAG TPA: hypothetical protein VGI22_08170 [Xanthobacteraceae bacterium]